MDAQQTGHVLPKLLELLIKKVPSHQVQDLKQFIHQYFASISEDEMAEREIEELYGIVMAHWQFLQKRQADEVKLKVFNPNLEEHGWSTMHTILMISMDDMPFLVRSVVMALNNLDINIHLVFHTGNLKVVRSPEGQLQQIVPRKDAKKCETCGEAAILIEIDRQPDDVSALDTIISSVKATLQDVKLAVEDFQPMVTKLGMLINHIGENRNVIGKHDCAETMDYLHWLLDEHYIFLGSADYDFDKNGAPVLQAGSELGLMKQPMFVEQAGFLEDLPTAQSLLQGPYPVLLSKTQIRSTVNRSSHLDVVSVLHFEDGKPVGQTRYVGLATSTAYHSSPTTVPILRDKVARVIEASGFSERSHDGKALLHVLETFPRDELFQIDADELLEISIGVLQLQERQRIRLFVHYDRFNRYVLCMVYVPRDIYNTEVRLKMQSILFREFNGQNINYKPNFTKSVLCRIDYVINTDPNQPQPHPSLKEIERMLTIAARDWRDDLRETLIESKGEQEGVAIFNRYTRAFPAGYREDFMPRVAVNDIRHIEYALRERKLSMCFYRLLEEPEDRIRFKLFQRDHGLALTDVLPILENMGLRVIEERPYEVKLPEGQVWISDFGMQVRSNVASIDAISERFQEAFAQIWEGHCESDSFNQLVIKAGLRWREIVLIRAIAKYLLQIGFLYSAHYIADSLGEYPQIAKALIDLFFIRFDLDFAGENREQAQSDLVAQIEEMLNSVANLDQDRIFRRYMEVICATVRTNYFQKNDQGEFKDYTSFKLKPRSISEMPQPVPLFEIFVYSPRVEGVHLRGGKVARGGLRWSDRKEDFRTEVLGLVKAQQVKNAVIVPMGAKGGFVAKQLQAEEGREAIMQEGIACYQIFIRSLLDVTDNIVNGKIAPPKDVIRYDEDDAYLVVAADKGTATFSDIANQVAEDYGFWLGDAFASGGSNGYDHKKMGITARGAWESVKRHFLELGTDIQKQDFTAVGVGDMSGDVFGNGMLLSKHTRLVAAFNHLHIFIDPNPDAAKSFAERKRLFELPRSTWMDYNQDLLSQGGGIFDRNAKHIAVSPEMSKRFGVKEGAIEPNALIRAILTAEVDLFWNGGIGTYIKASFENNIEVGDRANDAVRVDAQDLRCKVVGEGGNLGVTQQARVEFALKGGMVCTDAIDNSAGVDCSDHEVNIKILLNAAVSKGELTEEGRNKLLAEMEDEVAELVLYNNYHQTQAISNVFTYGHQALEAYIQLIKELERKKVLHRKLEFIPDNKALRARRAGGQGLTAPEFSVLMAYTKSVVKSSILKSGVPDEPYFERYLRAEFPAILYDRFPKTMVEHSLRREIIATQLTNDIVTIMGLTFMNRIHSETGATPGMIARAFVVSTDILGVRALWKKIESLDGKVSAPVQRSMMDDLARLVRRCCRWVIKNHRSKFDVENMITHCLPTVKKLLKALPDSFDSHSRQAKRQKINFYQKKGVPKALAEQVSNYTLMSPILDISMHADQSGIDLLDLAEVYYQCNDSLELYWLRSTLATSRDDSDYWTTLLGSALRDSLDQLQGTLAVSIVKHAKKTHKAAKAKVEHWASTFRVLVNRWNTMLRELQSSEYDFIRLSVAIRTLEDIAVSSTDGEDAYAERDIDNGA